MDSTFEYVNHLQTCNRDVSYISAYYYLQVGCFLVILKIMHHKILCVMDMQKHMQQIYTNSVCVHLHVHRSVTM